MPAAHRLLLIAVLALPWLWPFTSGPTAGTQPYLASMALAALLLALWPARQDPRQAVHWVATGWLLAAVVSAVIALLQYFDLEGPLYPWVDLAQPGQAFGNLRQPNQLATLLVIGLAALRMQLQTARWPAAPCAALAALLVAALAATASRIGMVELAALALLALGWARASGRWRVVLGAAVAALLLYAVAALVLPWLAETAEGVAGRDVLERLRTAESTCGSRVILWSNVLHLIAQKPWTGWGWGELSYAHYITLYGGPRFCHILDNAHNLPLHLAVELGVPVALAVCAALAWAVWRGAPWREPDATRQLAWAVLAAIGLHSLVEYPLWYGPFQIAAAISVGLLWASRKSASPTRARSAFTSARLGLALAMLGATAYAGWDYWRVSQIYLPLEQRAARWRDEPMAAARQTLLFGGAVRFAEVTTRPATRENAAWMLEAASRLLHYSPEPRVIERVIESATLLGREDLALAHLARFKAAFPVEERQWAEDNRRMLEGARALQGAASAARPSAR
ncbi:MAG: O-antigen ligase C-terminal domain-containing protein [Proteobacteria bacterium]|nr:O-antigen ligase C-terminal domain-containing protein [Pseudomonadota bacterium]